MFEQTFKNLDDILRKEAGCASELDYTEQTSWLLFLKYLDDLEAKRLSSSFRAQATSKSPTLPAKPGYKFAKQFWTRSL